MNTKEQKKLSVADAFLESHGNNATTVWNLLQTSVCTGDQIYFPSFYIWDKAFKILHHNN